MKPLGRQGDSENLTVLESVVWQPHDYLISLNSPRTDPEPCLLDRRQVFCAQSDNYILVHKDSSTHPSNLHRERDSDSRVHNSKAMLVTWWLQVMGYLLACLREEFHRPEQGKSLKSH